MKPQKNDPNIPKYALELKILNEFSDFIFKLKKSTRFKKDAITVIECLKFIKINLAFIGYAVEHRKDVSVYTYAKDKKKGILRDFNNTAMHFNAYHSSQLAQCALRTLVKQFEKAIQAMRDIGELEIFAYQLEYERHLGCIEGRTAKALSFAAIRLSRLAAPPLDDLMAQCEFDPNDDSATALAKANVFLKPYIKQTCIWKNKDYILKESLIKHYLTEIFGFEYEISLSEVLNIAKKGTTEECLSFIEKMSSSKLDEILLNPEQGSTFLSFIFEGQSTLVCLALIDKVSPSALAQAAGKQFSTTHWVSALKVALLYQNSLVCLALLKKIDINRSESLSLKVINKIFYQEIKSAFRKSFDTLKMAGISIGTLILIGLIVAGLGIIVEVSLPMAVGVILITEVYAIGLHLIKIAFPNMARIVLRLRLASYLHDITLYQSPEVLAEFFAKLPLQKQKKMVLPLDLPQMQRRLPHFLLSRGLQAESCMAFHNYLYTYKPLRDKLMSNKDSLLINCIDFYFEGKGEIAPKLKQLFIECLNTKSILSQKEKAFLEVLENVIPSISAPIDTDSYAIGRRGVPSWHHYRAYRLQENTPQLQSVLDRLISADLVLDGSPLLFTNEQEDREDHAAAQQAFACINQTKGLVKIIKPKDWQFFIRQLDHLNNRPKLRDTVYSPSHKFVHLTGKIVSYRKKRQPKMIYTHTKKTSTTLLSPQHRTSVFGENYGAPRLLVGILFNQEQCQLKAMLLNDSGTVAHHWLGNKAEVTRYKYTMMKINQTNFSAFAEEVKHRFHHNEVLAKVNKEAMQAIVIARDTPDARRMAIEYRDEIKKTFSIQLPIIFYFTLLQTLRHYTLSEQKDDIRSWSENQKVCTPREQVSKRNVLAIYDACHDRSAWQLGLFGSSARRQNKPIPKTVVFFEKIINKVTQSENFSSTWAEAEKNIKDTLIKKVTQNRFFKLVNGRSDDTVAFYKDLLTFIHPTHHSLPSRNLF